MAESDAVVKVIQDLLQLREHVDQQLEKCVTQLQGPCSQNALPVEVESVSVVQTPSIQLPLKRPFEEIEGSEASVEASGQDTDSLPCRVDLSVLAQFFLKECLRHHTEVESRVGRVQRPCYPYGNYPNYYTYRITNGTETDPRIQSFKKEWFHDKDCLDVGSHVGMLTLGIVTCYTPRSMTGIEIDPVLCTQAHCLRTQMIKTCKQSGRMDAVRSLKQTRFINDDFLNVSGMNESFDVVTCLSVSKWMHFHHGDAGMRTAFQLFRDMLRPNGILIFEPQSLKSYTQATRKQDMSNAPYRVASLKFLPDQFLEYLTNHLGFKQLETLTLSSSSKGFERPIHVLRKET